MAMFSKEDAQKIIQESQKKDTKTTYANEVESLKNFFRTVIGKPTTEEEEIAQLLAQNSEERDQYYQDLLTGLQAGAGEFSMQPGQPEVYTGPTKEELFKSMVAAEQSQPAEEKTEDKEEFKLPPSDETSLYKGIKDNDDKIMNYVYGGIAKKEWAGKEPIFDFVAISRKDKGKPTSSAFGPVQIVGNTVRDAMTRIKKGTEEYNFANRLQAAQNLFINLANKYKAGKNFNEQTAKETARTDSGKPALKILGITEDQFIDYVKDGYFLPSNQKKSKGLPPEILGDNYKENYYKLFKNVLSNKSVGTDSLKETIKKYYGHPSEKEKTRYMQDVFKNLNLSITQGK